MKVLKKIKMEKSELKKQELLRRMIILDSNFIIKSNIRAIEEQVKNRNKNRNLTERLGVIEKILFDSKS